MSERESLRTTLRSLLTTPCLTFAPGAIGEEDWERVVTEVAQAHDSKATGNTDHVAGTLILFGTVNALDGVFYAIVNGAVEERRKRGVSVVQQLLSLYWAAGPSPTTLLHRNLRRFALSYLTLSFTVEGLFEDETERGVVFVELLAHQRQPLFPSFFADWCDCVVGQNGDVESFEAALSVVFDAGLDRIVAEGLLSPLVPGVMTGLFAPALAVGPIAEFVTRRYARFLRLDGRSDAGSVDAVRGSFLGAFFSLAVDAPANLAPLRALLPPDYQPPVPLPALLSAFRTIREATRFVTATLHESLLLPLLRQSDARGARQMLLQSFALIARANRNRAKLQAAPNTINSDGFVMSAWAVLLRFCDPFTLADDATVRAKTALVDINFCFHNDLLDWGETSRVAMTPQEYQEFLTTRPPSSSSSPDTNYNFITQVFFLTLQFLQLGPLRLIQEYGATSREFVEIEGEVGRLETGRASWSRQPNAPMIERMLENLRRRMRELVDLRLTFDLHLKDDVLAKSTAALISFLFRWYEAVKNGELVAGSPLPRNGELTTSHPPRNGELTTSHLPRNGELTTSHPPRNELMALPEFVLEGVWEYLLFMARVERGFFTAHFAEGERERVFAMGARLLPDAAAIRNPYIRAKIAELFFSLLEGDEGDVRMLLARDTMAVLVPHMMEFYVQVEALGTSSAFYDKFSIRFHLTRVLLRLLEADAGLFQPARLADCGLDDGVFVRFVNLSVGDATYLLDESLSKLAEIREKQQRVERGETLSPEDQKMLAQTERQCQSLLLLGTESLQFLSQLTGAMPGPFLRPEILPRLTSMLNFNLVLLAGPRCATLKVANPEKYHFNPRNLLATLVGVYLALAGETAFVRNVAGDERSFSPQLFAACVAIMRRTGMGADMIDAFHAFATAVQGCRSDHVIGSDQEVALDDLPDDLLDPLLFTPMFDPVRLPTSQMIVDRATITAHLLNDPHDPFNRQPLQLDQVESVPELKAKMDSFLRDGRQKQEQQGQQGQQGQ